MKENTKITLIRNMAEEEISREGWDGLVDDYVIAFELDDGTVIYPARDYEGNGPGVIFGYNKNTNKPFALTPAIEEE